MIDTVHWLPLHVILDMDYQLRTIIENEAVIFLYDLNNETCKYLLILDGLTKIPDDVELGVLKGCLCLSQGVEQTHLVVWLIREFGDEKSWAQMLNASFEHLQIHNIQNYKIKVRVLCLFENDDVLLFANLCVKS